jgi:hypothetical protein
MFLGLNQRTRGPLFLLSIQLTAVGTETYIQIRAPIVRGSLRIYRNGVLQTIAQATLGVGNVVTLGTPASTGDVYFVEYLSHANVRFPASLPTVVTDPYFANLISLLHYNGTNGSTTFTDQIGGTTWTATNATLDTSTKQFGTASGKFSAGANSHILINTSAGFAIGTSADYCVEFWANGNSLTGDVCAFDCRDPGSGYVGTSVYLSASSTSNKPAVINSAAAIIASGASFPGGWNFCVLERYSWCNSGAICCSSWGVTDSLYLMVSRCCWRATAFTRQCLQLNNQSLVVPWCNAGAIFSSVHVKTWSVSSAVERRFHTAKVAGSIPAPSTTFHPNVCLNPSRKPVICRCA